MTNRFSEIKKLVDELEGDFEKFYDKTNQAAGTRVRKGMQDLKNLAQHIRLQVQDMKNTADGAASGSGSSGGAKKAAPAAKKAAAPAKKK